VSTPELRRGLKPGDVRVRLDRPHARYFRYVAPGTWSAKLAADAPTTPAGQAAAQARRFLFGIPISTDREIEERLPKWKALPVFSSDVMSSVAYATEASLYTLLGVGTIAFSWLLPISVAIVLVLALVTLSYRQTIRAYPNGGGSYIVAHANLGVLPGLVAAAALLTDYVLTVAVSVSSGVQALYSLFPPLLPVAVPLIVFFILLVMSINLRGIRESGSIFAAPTYLFLATTLALIGIGILRTMLGHPPQVTGVVPAHVPAETFGLLLLMRAFADGCSAMTGTEAVANGVPAFKPPEWKNARTTMLVMAVLLATMYLGTSFLSHVSGALPSASGESVLSQIGRAVYGPGPLWYVLQLSTMGILVLAANTSFADFPRLSSILARDGYMPRHFAYRGERLAFNAGIVALAVVSILLVIAFQGHVEALIPLYAIGVFTAFTLSQAGMVRHWFNERGAGWRVSAFFNGLGALTTAIVVAIFAVAKFALGAWIVIVIVPVLVALMLFVHHEYEQERRELDVRPSAQIRPPHRRQRVIVAAPAFTRALVQAVKVARTTSQDVSIVHVAEDAERGEDFRRRVEAQMPGVDVVLIESPYRSLVRPFLRYLDVAREEDPEAVLVVLIPEYEPRHWWERLLYNQNSRRIREALIGRPEVVVLDVPYRREGSPAPG
jgi:amino acid transporter